MWKGRGRLQIRQDYELLIVDAGWCIYEGPLYYVCLKISNIYGGKEPLSRPKGKQYLLKAKLSPSWQPFYPSFLPSLTNSSLWLSQFNVTCSLWLPPLPHHSPKPSRIIHQVCCYVLVPRPLYLTLPLPQGQSNAPTHLCSVSYCQALFALETGQLGWGEGHISLLHSTNTCQSPALCQILSQVLGISGK